MFEVVFPFELRAHKSKKGFDKSAYKSALGKQITSNVGQPIQMLTHDDGSLYHGIVYYFPPSRSKQPGDADNLAKLLWDSMEALAYKDDSILDIKTAGVFDESRIDISLNKSIQPQTLLEIQSSLQNDMGTVFVCIYQIESSQIQF